MLNNQFSHARATYQRLLDQFLAEQQRYTAAQYMNAAPYQTFPGSNQNSSMYQPGPQQIPPVYPPHGQGGRNDFQTVRPQDGYNSAIPYQPNYPNL